MNACGTHSREIYYVNEENSELCDGDESLEMERDDGLGGT